MAKRQNTKRFSLQGFDNKHYQTTQQYINAVNALFDRATAEIARATADGTYDPNKPFSFDDHPKVKSTVQNITTGLADNMISVVETGSRNQWMYACQKNDEFIAHILNTSMVAKEHLDRMQDRNLDALYSFQNRKVNGMDLSTRVWRYVGQYKDQIELGVDIGLSDGRSAQQLARDLKQYLVEPNRLFRRVRDKHGNLVLSKAAKAFHPGQGVYRSSVKNAQRLTRSEINMAYRQADWLRWQQLDFVVGFEVKVSDKHEEWLQRVWNKYKKSKIEISDNLICMYQKDFIFKGWHPQCMCYCVPVLMDEETFDKQELSDLKSALHGTEYKKFTAKNEVKDVPQGFKEWVEQNKERQSNWSSIPYFIRDNFKYGQLSHGLKFPTVHVPVVKQPVVDPVEQEMNRLEPLILNIKLRAAEYGYRTTALDNSIQEKNTLGIKQQIEALKRELNKLDRHYEDFVSRVNKTIEEASQSNISIPPKLVGVIPKRGWLHDRNNYEIELGKLDESIKKNKTPLYEVVDKIKRRGIIYNEVGKHTDKIEESEIISRIGGGDLTKGSCSSLAFAYAGNKGGYDVLDFRSGNSQHSFSTMQIISDIAEKCGGVVVEHTNDFTKANQLLKHVKSGKEYYFTCGKHAAIVRKASTGFEYLELQSATNNGFKPLTTDVLRYRFGAQKTHTIAGRRFATKECIIDIDLLNNNSDFKELLGYINTQEEKQRKGAKGRMR